MTSEPIEPIWEKELERFTLQEYEQKPHSLSCTIIYNGLVYAGNPEDGDVGEIQFSFLGWGMEREEITAEQCFMTCQSLLWSNANVSVSTFARCLDYALPDFVEEEDDEIELCSKCHGKGVIGFGDVNYSCTFCDGRGSM